MTDDIVNAIDRDEGNSDKDADGKDDTKTAPASQSKESVSNADIMESVVVQPV